MWPQPFFIGGSAGQPLELVDTLTGIIAISSGIVDVPTPTGGLAGDIQFLKVHWATNGSPVLPSEGNGQIGLSPGQWRPISLSHGRVSIYPYRLYWRVLAVGLGGDAPFRFTQGSGALYVRYITTILRNVKLTDPFLQITAGGSTTTLAGTNKNALYPVDGVHVSSDRDMLFSMVGSFSVDGDWILPPEAGEVLLARTHTTDLAALRPSGMSLTVGKTTRMNTHTNLFPSASGLTGWTFEGVSHASYNNGWILTPLAGVGKHEANTTAVLEAGKRYAFFFLNRKTSSVTGAGSCAIGLLYEKPDTSLHGILVNSGLNSFQLFGEVASLNDLFSVGRMSNSTNGWTCAMEGLNIAADQTGTWKFRIVVLQQVDITGSTDPDNLTGHTNIGLAFTSLQLQEIPSEFVGPVAPGARERFAGDYDNNFHQAVRPRPPAAAIGDSQSANFTLLQWRGANTHKRKQTKLMSPHIASFIKWDSPAQLSRFRFCTPFHALTTSLIRPIDMQSSQCVSQYNSQQKFYFEVKWDWLPTVNSQLDYFHVGVFPGCDGQWQWNDSNIPDEAAGYALAGTGTLFQDGVAIAVEGTYPQWVTGDIIGVCIRFDNFTIEFYINGVFQASVAMTADHKYMPWTARMHFFSQGSGIYTDYNTSFTASFRGPFGGRKPAGAVAFDFDNEIGDPGTTIPNVYAADDTWTKPPGLVGVTVICFGGGGGGGGGSRTSGSLKSGGGGGGGGGRFEKFIAASELSSTVDVTVGVGGVGGVGGTSLVAQGEAGTAGTASSFGGFCTGFGGGAGAGGNQLNAAGGTAGFGNYPGGVGGTGGSAPGVAGGSTTGGGGGGGGGGGQNSVTYGAGGDGGSASAAPGGAGGVATVIDDPTPPGGTFGDPGDVGTDWTVAAPYTAGAGGGGGGALRINSNPSTGNYSVKAPPGAAGGFPGGGGGGGGAMCFIQNQLGGDGAGGAGGAVVVLEHY